MNDLPQITKGIQLPAGAKYKLYVFLNCFDLNDTEGEAVQFLKSDNRTLLFIYATGLGRVMPNEGIDSCIENLTTLTSLQMTEDTNPQRLRVSLIPDHRLAHGLGRDATWATTILAEKEAVKNSKASFR